MLCESDGHQYSRGRAGSLGDAAGAAAGELVLEVPQAGNGMRVGFMVKLVAPLHLLCVAWHPVRLAFLMWCISLHHSSLAVIDGFAHGDQIVSCFVKIKRPNSPIGGTLLHRGAPSSPFH
jgi:hypothetical protein